MSAGSAAPWDDSKPMVGEIDRSVAVECGGGKVEGEAAVLAALAGDLAEVDQPCRGVKVKRKPRADDMLAESRTAELWVVGRQLE